MKFKSSEVGTLRTRGLQGSSVQSTRPFFEFISNVNYLFLLKSTIYDCFLERIGVPLGSENSHFFKCLLTKMAVSMVSS